MVAGQDPENRYDRGPSELTVRGETQGGGSGSPMGPGQRRPLGHRGVLVKLDLTQSGKAERASRRRCLRRCLV